MYLIIKISSFEREEFSVLSFSRDFDEAKEKLKRLKKDGGNYLIRKEENYDEEDN